MNTPNTSRAPIRQPNAPSNERYNDMDVVHQVKHDIVGRYWHSIKEDIDEIMLEYAQQAKDVPKGAEFANIHAKSIFERYSCRVERFRTLEHFEQRQVWSLFREKVKNDVNGRHFRQGAQKVKTGKEQYVRRRGKIYTTERIQYKRKEETPPVSGRDLLGRFVSLNRNVPDQQSTQ